MEKIRTFFHQHAVHHQLIINRILMSFFLVFFFVLFVYPTAMKFSQSYKFVDEDEHMAIAGLMLNHGMRLYTDISSNHQPINYLTSFSVQKATHPANVFMLIRRHRQAVVFFSFIGGLLMVFRFGSKGLLFVVMMEIVKYSLLGNEFLAESLVIYPFAYTLGSQLELAVNQKVIREDFLLGFLASLITFTLLPLVPATALLLGYRYLVAKAGSWKLGLLGFITLTLAIFIWINPQDYFRETVINNVLYAMPRLSQIKTPTNWMKLWAYPFLSLLQPMEWLTLWISLITVGWIGLTIGFLIKADKKGLGLMLVLFLIWGVVNARVIKPGVAIYGGFHLLPWLAMGMVVVIFLLVDLLHKKYLWAKVALLFLMCATFGLMVHPKSPVMAEIDPATENYVQYTPTQQVSEIITALANDTSQLLVFPDEAIIHWQTNLQPADRQVTHYEWQYFAPEQQEAYQRAITQNLPDFIVYDEDNSSYGKSITALLGQEYTQVFRSPNLYIRQDYATRMSQEQLQILNSLTLELEMTER